MVVLEDADLGLAAEAALEAAYLCAGQSCTAGERFLVHAAIRADGDVAWRVAHSDVVVEADLIGGRLVLSSFGGQTSSLDPATGRSGT